MSNCENTFRKKKRSATGLLIALVILSGTFIIFGFVNVDSNINLRVPLSFTIKKGVTIPGINVTTFEFSNLTIDPSLLILDSFSVIFDSVDFKNNQSQIIQSYIQRFKDVNEENDTLSHQYTFQHVTTSAWSKMRGYETSFKLPRGNGILAIIFSFALPYNDFGSPGIFFLGVLPDSLANLKELDYGTTSISLNQLSFDNSTYSDYFNYMSGQTDVIPNICPYKVDFTVEKTPFNILDIAKTEA